MANVCVSTFRGTAASAGVAGACYHICRRQTCKLAPSGNLIFLIFNIYNFRNLIFLINNVIVILITRRIIKVGGKLKRKHENLIQLCVN